VNQTPSIAEHLSALAGRLAELARSRAVATPDARVRLARPLEIPALAQAERLLALDARYVGGAEPKEPYAPSLAAFQDQISGCLRCPLGGRRKHIVFGEGDPASPLAFVAAGPGGDEDLAGRPLVGAAGGLLDRVVAAMGYKRSEVYLCTVVKCRPAGREPEAADVASCRPYLEHQLRLLRPKAVIALGETAARLLLDSGEPLAALRGRWGSFLGMRVMPTFHPSDLLRDPGLKRHVWDDMKLVMKVLKEA
jgi:DNA polymerase